MLLDEASLSHLWLVQSAAAPLLAGTHITPITPILASLHWLPVSDRIPFNISQFVFKAFQGLAPKDTSDLINLEVFKVITGPGES